MSALGPEITAALRDVASVLDFLPKWPSGTPGDEAMLGLSREVRAAGQALANGRHDAAAEAIRRARPYAQALMALLGERDPRTVKLSRINRWLPGEVS